MFRLAFALLAALPWASAQLNSCVSIYETVCNDRRYTTLCGALQQANLNGTLSEGEWTLFAPSDVAFIRFFQAASPLTLEFTPIEILTDLMLYHVAENEINSFDLSNRCRDLMEMANGEDTRTLCDRDGNIFQKGGGNPRDNMPKVVVADVRVCNGIVHAVDEVLVPFSLRAIYDADEASNSGNDSDNDNDNDNDSDIGETEDGDSDTDGSNGGGETEVETETEDGDSSTSSSTGGEVEVEIETEDGDDATPTEAPTEAPTMEGEDGDSDTDGDTSIIIGTGDNDNDSDGDIGETEDGDTDGDGED